MTTADRITNDLSRPEQRDGTSGEELVHGLSLGARQAEGPLAVFPLFANRNGGAGEAEGAATAPLSYVTLRQALGAGDAVITEVSEGGSVPELQIVNKGDAQIIVLDGEELHGAKQNRVLSVSILIDAHTTQIVPVSCTEQGRWSYASRQFAESEVLAERRVRYSMRDSSHAAMRSGAPVHADQGAVWGQVEELHARNFTYSPTRAMRDAYDARKHDLDRLLAAFPLVDGQNGVLVLHGSRVVGCDFVSRAPQYAQLHDKLLRSYAFEALVRGGEPGERTQAEAFFERITALQGERFKSPGLGWDVRFQGNGVLGSALEYRGHVAHAAFFDVGGASGSTEDPEPEQRSGWRIADARERARRRQWR